MPRAGWMGITVALGVLCFTAYFIENAHQTWGALTLEDVHATRPALSAAAPTLFAVITASTRFSLQRLVPRFSSATLVGAGATIAGVGTGMVAASPTAPVAFAGIVVAGTGTAVIAPTLFSVTGRAVAPALRGRAVSVVTTIGYGGFLASPAAVGVIAVAGSLRWAFASVAAIAVISAPVGAFVVRRS